jgi:hypothetical protein
MFIAYKDDNGTIISTKPTESSTPVLFIEEEISYYKEGFKDCIEIIAIFNTDGLEETSINIGVDCRRQFISKIDQKVTVVRIVIEKIFFKSPINIFISGSCSREIESQTYITINNFWLSSKDNEIKRDDICINSTPDLVLLTSSLFQYISFIEDLKNSL